MLLRRADAEVTGGSPFCFVTSSEVRRKVGCVGAYTSGKKGILSRVLPDGPRSRRASGCGYGPAVARMALARMSPSTPHRGLEYSALLHGLRQFAAAGPHLR